DGSGHYVKMVHNGIEYGDMQVIAEAYHLMKRGLGLSHDEMASIFRRWNEGVLDSYLVEITGDILALEVDGERRVEMILDAAGQKGTGKWTVISSMELGQPTTLVAEAVYARIVSALKGDRVGAAGILSGPSGRIADTEGFVDDIEQALYASKIVSYGQGFMLMKAASDEHGWDLDLGRIAKLWRAGCIIRARFLDDITAAFERLPDNLMVDEFFSAALANAQDGWRRVVMTAVGAGLPVPAYATALAFYDSFRSADLPANLIQAQRDYFGAHTYERRDRPRGEFFHTDWLEGGAETPASLTRESAGSRLRGTDGCSRPRGGRGRRRPRERPHGETPSPGGGPRTDGREGGVPPRTRPAPRPRGGRRPAPPTGRLPRRVLRARR